MFLYCIKRRRRRRERTGFNWASRKANPFTGAEFWPDRNARPILETGRAHNSDPKGSCPSHRRDFNTQPADVCADREESDAAADVFTFIFDPPADILSMPVFHTWLTARQTVIAILTTCVYF